MPEFNATTAEQVKQTLQSMLGEMHVEEKLDVHRYTRDTNYYEVLFTPASRFPMQFAGHLSQEPSLAERQDVVRQILELRVGSDRDEPMSVLSGRSFGRLVRAGLSTSVLVVHVDNETDTSRLRVEMRYYAATMDVADVPRPRSAGAVHAAVDLVVSQFNLRLRSPPIQRALEEEARVSTERDFLADRTDSISVWHLRFDAVGTLVEALCSGVDQRNSAAALLQLENLVRRRRLALQQTLNGPDLLAADDRSRDQDFSSAATLRVSRDGSVTREEVNALLQRMRLEAAAPSARIMFPLWSVGVFDEGVSYTFPNGLPKARAVEGPKVLPNTYKQFDDI